MPAKKAQIYQFKITLKGIRPPIWRRFQVNSHITFFDLHTIIQDVMGWENYHLFQYFIGGYNISDAVTIQESGFGDAVAEKTWVDKLLQSEGQKFTYEYDFGDSWEHELLLEKILPPEDGATYPRVIKGKRACPPEDCGGVWGYQELLELLQDPKSAESEENAEILDWLGDDFDPEEFDQAAINEQLIQRAKRK